MISTKFASFLSFLHLSSVTFTDFTAFKTYIFFRKFHFIFENSSGMKGLNKHPKYISLSRNGLTLANMTVLTGKTPKLAK